MLLDNELRLKIDNPAKDISETPLGSLLAKLLTSDGLQTNYSEKTEVI
jgi:hypothetical protein